jgi:type I restriction enzyme M protein
MQDFIDCYNPKNRHKRKESDRFKAFDYEEIIQRDKISLDIFWLRDEFLENTANLPEPEVLADDIIENLEAALEQFREIRSELGDSE